MIFIFVAKVNAEEKVPVYMFTKEGCSACEAAFDYFDELESENPDLFELVVFEVFDSEWNVNNEDLKDLLIAVYEEFNEDTSKAATPTIIIGDYHTIGLPQDTSIVKDAIVEVKDNKEQKDVVKKLAKELKMDINILKKDDTNNSSKDTKSNTDIIIVIGIFIILIGGLLGLVVVSKK